MIWHPFALAITTADCIALLFLARGSVSALRTVAVWSDGSSQPEQIRLEIDYEAGTLSARAASVLLLLSTLLLVIAITNIFPHLVPGAMCGTGVLQAGGGLTKAFLFRLPAVALLYLWAILETLNRSRPDFPLARLAARHLLLTVPLAFLAVFQTTAGLIHLNTHSPVNCCAMVYDRISGVSEAGNLTGMIGDKSLLLLFGGATVLLGLLGVTGRFSPARHTGKLSLAAAITALAWGPLSAIVLVRIFAAYIYQVLNHHCPWCLFLPEHHYIGFFLFFFLGMALLQAAAAVLLFRVSIKNPGLSAESSSRRALSRMTLFVLLFTATAACPAIFWRLRYGVWMG